MKRIDKIKNMTVEEMAREIIRLNFTDEYCDNGCPDTWDEPICQHEPAKLISTPIKQKDIDALKEKYTKGMGIEIRQGDKKLYGRVIKHFKHFMTVQTRHYPTSISYVDILIGAVKIK